MDSWSRSREVEKPKPPHTKAERRAALRDEAAVRGALIARQAEQVKFVLGAHEVWRALHDARDLITRLAAELEP